MSETLTTDYQAISDMAPVERKLLGQNFYVQVTGKTKDAHQDFVQQLKKIGEVQVQFLEDSDYLVVFCPIISRAGTDIGEALANIPGDKPTILVAMHHTTNPEYLAGDSRRQVDAEEHPNILLTVDVLFFNHRLLKCNRNHIAWSEVQKFLGVPEVFSWKKYFIDKLMDPYWRIAFIGLSLSVVFIIATVLAVKLRES